MQITDEHRALAREESEQTAARGAMSEKNAARLRVIREEDRIERCGELRFASALASVIVTPDNLARLVGRCSSDQSHLQRRALKLAWFIGTKGNRLGTEIATPGDVLFLSALTRDEETMTDAQFAEAWRVKKVFKRTESGQPAAKPCVNKGCGRGEGQTRARVAKAGDSCSRECRNVVKAVMTRARQSAKPAWATA